MTTPEQFLREKMSESRSEIYGAFAAERNGSISKIELSRILVKEQNKMLILGLTIAEGEVERHQKTNTYEENEALVFQTTLKETLSAIAQKKLEVEKLK